MQKRATRPAVAPAVTTWSLEPSSFSFSRDGEDIHKAGRSVVQYHRGWDFFVDGQQRSIQECCDAADRAEITPRKLGLNCISTCRCPSAVRGPIGLHDP